MAEKKKDKAKATQPVGQRQLLFFGPGTNDGSGNVVASPQPDDIRAFLDRSNPDSPYYGYVGNEGAVEKLNDVMFAAHMSPNHCAGPDGLAFIGPASTGKTDLARRTANGLGTTILGKKKYRHGYFPFVECDRSIKNTGDLLTKIREVLQQAGVPLVPQVGSAVQTFKAPPCVIYFDEAQAIRGDWLLKATERTDAKLITDDAVVDCKNVLWIISTTHEGKLPRAFHTRFRPVYLYPYTLAQVAQIVNLNHGDLPGDVCTLIAGYGGRVPRKALDFAAEVKLAALRIGSDDWAKACAVVGERNGVDAEGLNRRHLNVLIALFNSRRGKQRTPLALKRLGDQCNVEECDLEEYILPALMVQTEDHPPLVRGSSLGLELTEEGVKALVRRKLVQQIGPNAGQLVSGATLTHR